MPNRKDKSRIRDAAQRIIEDARVYMAKHNLSLSTMSALCGFPDLLLRRNGGIASPDWRPSIDVLEKLEKGMRTNPNPANPKRGRPKTVEPRRRRTA